jgi:8-oxo-dGTP pyrophosphatase MutT (NUDIX family)
MIIKEENRRGIIGKIEDIIFPVDHHNSFDRKEDTTSDPGTTYENKNYKLIPSAVLIPLIWRSGYWKVILTKRSIRLKKHAGQIAFPGGKYDTKDKKPYNTALREANEEIGLNFRQVKLLGSLQAHETITGFRIFPFIGIISSQHVLIANHDEVAEIFEVPLSVVLDKKRFSKHALELKGDKREYLAIPYGPNYIWGATARILFNLSDKISKISGN